MKKAILKTFGIFTGKHLCWRPFLISLKDEGLQIVKRDRNAGVSM